MAMMRLALAAACALAATVAAAGDMPEMVLIPAGSYQMGSTRGEPGRALLGVPA